ncbi:MAG: TonB-dependent receptor [Prolixibacteraceae bacterium]|nr:TonB-dependent receptor [Prolixibacteraceae bacterium]
MKLTTILTLVFTCSLYASVYSQGTKISQEMRGWTVREVFQQIERESRYRFFYNDELKDIDRKVEFSTKDSNVEEILEQLFSNSDVSYEIMENNLIALKLKTNYVNGLGQQLSVSVKGKVTDSSGQPLPGVSVVIKGTTTGTITDAGGNYSLSNVPEDATLQFSFVGMKGQEIKVNGQDTIHVKLSEETISVEDVVVIGYGSRAKKDVTTAISSIKSEDIVKSIAMSPEMSLQGQMTGVQVTGNSGNPMATPEVRIRGVNTWGISSPLYVIDGIPIMEYGAGVESMSGLAGYEKGPLNIMTMINPNDIESISVLKDASAAAIYGVRAANGVILITTKKGQGDKPRLEFSYRSGIQNIVNRIDVLDTKQYADLMRRVYESDPTLPVNENNVGLFDPNSPKYLGNSPTYDHQKAIQNRNALYSDYSLQLVGGTSKTDYFFSLNYSDTEGTIKGNDLTRYSGAMKINSSITNWLRMGVNYRIASAGGLDETYYTQNIIFTAGTPPWQPIYDPTGPYGYAQLYEGRLPNGAWSTRPLYGAATRYNSLALMELMDENFSSIRNMGNAYIELEPIKKLKIRGQVSLDMFTKYTTRFFDYDAAYFGESWGDPKLRGGGQSVGRYMKRTNNNKNLLRELMIDYNNKFGDHTVSLLFSAVDQVFDNEVIAGETEYMTTRDKYLRQLGGENQYTSVGSTLFRSALVGYIGRIGYNYKGKYYIDASLRRDGSARFAPENRWGYFPATSVAWRLSEESVLKELKWLTDLKFRAGWGQLGNQEVRDMAYVSPIATSPIAAWGTTSDGYGNRIQAATVFGMPNVNLQWERTSTLNVGFDAILIDKLNLSAEYYNKLTNGILQEVSLPLSVGVKDQPVDNIASVRNSGIEISFRYNNQIGNLAYGFGGNLSTVKNRVESTYKDIPLDNIEKGYSMYYIKGYKVGGIFQTVEEVNAWKAKYTDANYQTAKVAPGDMYFLDLRGAPKNPNEFYSNEPDGVIDAYDRVYLGKTIPGYHYGFDFNLKWKGIDLNAQFTGVGDIDKINPVRAMEYPTTGGNTTTDILLAWTQENKSTTHTRIINGDPASNFRDSDRFLESGAYLRLSSIQVGYTLPARVCNSIGIGIRNARIYMGANNLFTITPYTGLDPENDYYPTPRVFLLGLNVNL